MSPAIAGEFHVEFHVELHVEFHTEFHGEFHAEFHAKFHAKFHPLNSHSITSPAIAALLLYPCCMLIVRL